MVSFTPSRRVQACQENHSREKDALLPAYERHVKIRVSVLACAGAPVFDLLLGNDGLGIVIRFKAFGAAACRAAPSQGSTALVGGHTVKVNVLGGKIQRGVSDLVHRRQWDGKEDGERAGRAWLW